MTPSLSDMHRHFLAQKVSPRTLENYLRICKQCLQSQDILEPLKTASSGFAYDSIRKAIRHISIVANDPSIFTAAKAVPRPKNPPKQVKGYFDVENYRKAIQAVQQYVPTGQREVALLVMLSGLRIGDVFRITRQNAVDARTQAEVTILQKGDRERPWKPSRAEKDLLGILLSMGSWSTLQRFYEGKLPAGMAQEVKYNRAYQRYRTVTEKAFRKAGVKSIHPHAFRHAFAVLAMDGGASINTVMGALGHSSVQTTYRYIKSTTGDKISEAQDVVQGKLQVGGKKP